MKILLSNSECCHILNRQIGPKVAAGISVCISCSHMAIPRLYIYIYNICSFIFIIIQEMGSPKLVFGGLLCLTLWMLLVDDARLLLGIHYHGFGNWENIRLDERLGLTKKIAPVELQHHETFLPRAPNLKERANALLEMVGNCLDLCYESCDRAFLYPNLLILSFWILNLFFYFYF